MAAPESGPYDDIAEWYAGWVTTSSWVHGVLTEHLPGLWDSAPSQNVLDVACGEGTFSRLLAGAGHRVVGIDNSPNLLEIARIRSVGSAPQPSFRVDDAQILGSCGDNEFDGAICVMALMDIPDLAAVYSAVRRVVRPGGWFAIAITHPCFDSPHAGWLETHEPTTRTVTRYLDEGTWRSRVPESIRGRVGAQHRTLSTYLNTAIETGWQLDRLVEPAGGPPGQNPSIARLLLARFR